MKIYQVISCLLFAVSIMACSNDIEKKAEVTSPDGALSLKITMDEQGRPNYTIYKNNSEVIKSSKLGIVRSDADFSKDLTLSNVRAITKIHDHYKLQCGKQKEVSYHANKLVVSLINADEKSLNIIFQVSNDGVVFRYAFPEDSDEEVKILEEKTEYHFPQNAKAWLQPVAEAKSGWGKTNPSYEEYYEIEIPVGTKSPTKAGWIYPALFKTNNDWVAITETALNRYYCGTRLTVSDSANATYQVTFPDSLEIFPGGELLPNSTLPWKTPWRVLTIGSLKTVTESTLGTDVATPTIDLDFSYVKPGLASWSWIILKDDSTIYDVQKKYIDFAADRQWPYCLIDANWDETIGYEKMQDLIDYADDKGVGILLWYNSSGDWNTTPQTPKSKLLSHGNRDAEFARIKEMGVKGVKVDFFGGDGQSMISYYHDMILDAAKHGLLINCHGATLPRGWQRTYPNVVTFEAVRGFENVTFLQEDADRQPIHCTMLPFTRNLFDAMDYTPMNLTSVPDKERRTLPSFELALPVIFQSGIQHMAETPEGIKRMPDYVKKFLSACPAAWDETRFIEGYPGKYVVMARRSGDKWYIAGINAEAKEVIVSLDLSFLANKNIVLIVDGDNGENFKQEEIDLNHRSTIDVVMKINGGFVICQ